MKICPKCKRLQSSAWQICSDCNVELETYRAPFYRSIFKVVLAALSLLIASLPLTSKLLLSVDKMFFAMPAGLKDVAIYLSNPWALSVSVAAIFLWVLAFLYWIIINEFHPDHLIHNYERGP
jgi:hypothetical protein